MENLSINYNPDYIKMPEPWWRRKKFWIWVGAAVVVGYFAFQLGLAYTTIVIDKNEKVPWWGRVAGILPFNDKEPTPVPTPDPNPMPEQEPDRLDILVFGIRGEDDLENGGLLADSIQILSIDKKTKKTSVISLPRDLYINDVLGITGKLNEIYSRGLARGIGFSLPKEVISKITGVYIDKIIVLDFSGFVGIIDEVGGVDITLEKEFKEGEQWGYEFYLPAGENHIDGQQALYYVRSRYSTNDFDRSNRQQRVMLALKSKILSLDTLLNPIKLYGLVSHFKANLRTDIGLSNIKDIMDFSSSLSQNDPVTYVVSIDNLLYQEIGEGLYHLLPNGGNYEQIKLLFRDILDDK